MPAFDEFLKSLQDKEKQKNEEKAKLNPEERIAYFQKLVSDFFNTLEADWFGESLEKGLMSIEKDKVTITEEALGQYTTEKRRLILGSEKIDFVPIGTVLLGTDARIDLIYNQTKVMFVHVGENIKGSSDLIMIRINGVIVSKKKDPGQKVWKFTYGNARTLYATANAQSVQQLIMDIINEKA